MCTEERQCSGSLKSGLKLCLCFHCSVLPKCLTAAREKKHHHKGFLYDGIIHTCYHNICLFKKNLLKYLHSPRCNLFPLRRKYSVYTMLCFYNPTKCFCVIPIGTNMSMKSYTAYWRWTLYLHNASGVEKHVWCDWSVGLEVNVGAGTQSEKRHFLSECLCVRSTCSFSCKPVNFICVLCCS